MAIVAKYDEGVNITGRLVPNTLSVATAGWAANANIRENAKIDASKIIRRHRIIYSLDDAFSIVTVDDPIFLLNGSAGTIKSFSGAISNAISGTGLVIVRLQKSTGGGGFNDVLTGILNFSAADTPRVTKSVAIDSSAGALVADDILLIDIDGISTAGSPGLVLNIEIDETP